MLIVVQSFAPYVKMCQMNRGLWEQHGYPVVVISPEDSFCDVPGMKCEAVGREAWAGPVSLDRWRAMLEWMLRQPYNYFLMHESDSICLRRSLPDFAPGVLYSNEMLENAVPPTQKFYCLAPWVLNRELIGWLLDVSKRSPDRPPYHGDRWVGQMIEEGGIPHSPFTPGIGCGTLGPEPELTQVCNAVRQGAYMIHGVKTEPVLKRLLQCVAR